MNVFAQPAVIGKRDGDGKESDDLPSLVEAARHGRPAALERLIARVQFRVWQWAERFTGDPDAADDVAQDVLITLGGRIEKFDGQSRFSTWLFSVTRNVALTRRRREQHRAALLTSRIAATDYDATAADPDLDAATLASIALRYFDALPPKQRIVFELADIRGMAPAEIARHLGMEQATVRAHLFKARRSIRMKMLKHHKRLIEDYRS